MAACGAALLLSFQAYSAWTVVHEAGHDCCGRDCPVCAEIQECFANFQSPGPVAESVELAVRAAAQDFVFPPAGATAPVRDTLVSLKVRMDE